MRDVAAEVLRGLIEEVRLVPENGQRQHPGEHAGDLDLQHATI
jgi:hypothetical protein